MFSFNSFFLHFMIQTLKPLWLHTHSFHPFQVLPQSSHPFGLYHRICFDIVQLSPCTNGLSDFVSVLFFTDCISVLFWYLQF
jgi:hypothetical protein